MELAYKALDSRAAEYWRRAKVLIIDEISMISADLFDKIDYVARVVRGINRPFGGVQLVVCGDFFQLPPVQKKNADEILAMEEHEERPGKDHPKGQKKPVATKPGQEKSGEGESKDDQSLSGDAPIFCSSRRHGRKP